MSMRLKAIKVANEFGAKVCDAGATLFERLSKPSALDKMHETLGNIIAGRDGATADRSPFKQTMQRWSEALRTKADNLKR